jgi:hypothetical protein
MLDTLVAPVAVSDSRPYPDALLLRDARVDRARTSGAIRAAVKLARSSNNRARTTQRRHTHEYRGWSDGPAIHSTDRVEIRGDVWFCLEIAESRGLLGTGKAVKATGAVDGEP